MLYLWSATVITVILFFCSFFTDTATPEIYTLSLHDALPISDSAGDQKVFDFYATAASAVGQVQTTATSVAAVGGDAGDRKSTRLNSSHLGISYAVFCLKKKNKKKHGEHEADISVNLHESERH